jgi:hypothetical protein
MARCHLNFAVAVLLVAAAGCERALPTESRAAAGSAASADRAPSVPFRLDLTGNANPDFSQGPCDVANVESGTGEAEHLGRVTWTSHETATFCVDPTNPSLASVTGTMVIIAANGDQLTQTYTTTVTADFTAGTLTATGTYVVAGGTGRFADATGGGRTFEIRTGSGAVLAKEGDPVIDGPYTKNLAVSRRLPAATSVQVIARHNSAAAVLLEPQSGDYVHIDIAGV